MFSSWSRMRKALLLLLTLGASIAHANAAAHANPAQPDKPAEITPWRSGLTEINEDWLERDGDNPAWAQPAFDDSKWQNVDLDSLGPAQAGSRWYRLHLNLGPDHSHVQLLLQGGDGVYELYVNGVLMPDAHLHSAFAVSRPAERVFSLSNPQGDFALALRTRTPANYAAYHLPLFLSVTTGQPTAIDYEHRALESDRISSVLPSAAINLLLCFAAFASLALCVSQGAQREYLFLGLYLLLNGIANLLWVPQQAGILPTSVNFWIADPLIYVFTIFQIEFTFSFARKRPNRFWRIYEIILLCPIALIVPAWYGHFSFDVYILVESAFILPAAVLLPVILFVWYRRGNREAGWLILPSLLPALTLSLLDLGDNPFVMRWLQVDFLNQPIAIGPAYLQLSDLGTLIFLIAIAFVMFFRFTRVSREQAFSAAELNAAREIQQRLVPAALPHVPNYTIEAAYLPAQEVGGDFYQVLAQPDGATLILVGDVSGKGLKAAMTGALAIGALRTLSSEGLAPAALLTRLNQQLQQTQDAGFVTCLCARIHPTGQVILSNAGHLAPYRNGAEVPIESGLPLGITAEAAYPESSLQLDSEDSLTLISDGVLEARKDTGELYGFERTAAIATQSAAAIAKAAQLFGQEDDITVLTLRFTSQPISSTQFRI